MLWEWYKPVTGFNPLSLDPTLWLDFESSTFTTESGNRVVQWNDRSGNNNHATAVSGSAARPTLGSNGVVFDGVENWLLATAPVVQPYTVFGVVQHAVGFPNSPSLLRLGTYTLFFTRTRLPTYLGVYMQSVGNISHLCTPGTTRHLQSFVVNSGSSFIGLNGVGSSVTLGTDNPTDNAAYIGSNNLNPYYMMIGTISSILVIPRALSVGKRQQCEQFLASRYGVSL